MVLPQFRWLCALVLVLLSVPVAAGQPGVVQVETTALLASVDDGSGRPRLDLTTLPGRARVVINGQFRGFSPLSLTWPTGLPCQITVDLPGFRPAGLSLTPAALTAYQLTVELIPARGRLQLDPAEPTASLQIDGQLQAWSDDVAAGEHRVVLRRFGYADIAQTCLIADGQTTVLQPRWQPLPPALTAFNLDRARLNPAWGPPWSVLGLNLGLTTASPLTITVYDNQHQGHVLLTGWRPSQALSHLTLPLPAEVALWPEGTYQVEVSLDQAGPQRSVAFQMDRRFQPVVETQDRWLAGFGPAAAADSLPSGLAGFGLAGQFTLATNQPGLSLLGRLGLGAGLEADLRLGLLTQSDGRSVQPILSGGLRWTALDLGDPTWGLRLAVGGASGTEAAVWSGWRGLLPLELWWGPLHLLTTGEIGGPSSTWWTPDLTAALVINWGPGRTILTYDGSQNPPHWGAEVGWTGGDAPISLLVGSEGPWAPASWTSQTLRFNLCLLR